MSIPLSLDDLSNIVGCFSDSQYVVIKQELDGAAARNDFEAFLAIVKKHTPAGGKEFVYTVVDDYTRTNFLTSARCAQLYAELLDVM